MLNIWNLSPNGILSRGQFWVRINHQRLYISYFPVVGINGKVPMDYNTKCIKVASALLVCPYSPLLRRLQLNVLVAAVPVSLVILPLLKTSCGCFIIFFISISFGLGVWLNGITVFTCLQGLLIRSFCMWPLVWASFSWSVYLAIILIYFRGWRSYSILTQMKLLIWLYPLRLYIPWDYKESRTVTW